MLIALLALWALERAGEQLVVWQLVERVDWYLGRHGGVVPLYDEVLIGSAAAYLLNLVAFIFFQSIRLFILFALVVDFPHAKVYLLRYALLLVQSATAQFAKVDLCLLRAYQHALDGAVEVAAFLLGAAAWPRLQV